MQIQTIKTSVFYENADLFQFIKKNIKTLPEKSVVAITSKIVALSEGRVVEYKSNVQKIKIIKSESDFALKTKYVWLTIKDGMVMANAGLDESNAKRGAVLLPRDSFNSAELIRNYLKKEFNVKQVGVLITDSRIFPLRSGIVGVALGYAGFEGVRNYVGKKDMFGKILKMSRTDIADSLATSAVLCMGEGSEQQPLAVITNAPIKFIEKINRGELQIDVKDDLYMPLFKKIKND